MSSRPLRFLFLLLGFARVAQAGLLLPTMEGTAWEYESTGGNEGNASAATMTVQIHGKETSKGKVLLRFDTLAENELVKEELLSVDERGVLRYERTLGNGNTVSFDPPQTILPPGLKIGAKWDFDDVLAGSETHQQFNVAGEEEMEVPAGKFHTFRLHCEQPWPISITIDRWFSPGTGVVKDITTSRGPTGRLLNRTTMVLKKISIPTTPTPVKIVAPPIVEVSPSPSPAPAPVKITLELAKERDGAAVAEFRSDVPNIFVRWSGENLAINSEARIVWIAEDVGDVAPPNFVVDETTSTITRPDFGARFTLSRPKDGWAPGKYRVELYLEDELKEKLEVAIRD